MTTATDSANRADRLYNLLPVVYRLRDVDQGYPLRALLRVISEQVNLVEDDISQLYENWFIETCQDWVIPYVGSLIGYQPLFDANELSDVSSKIGQARNRILIPRAEVANTIRFRRRKGTISILEDLASAVAGWPSRAVEFYRLLSVFQNIDYLHLDRGFSADIRNGDAMENIDGPFDKTARNVDVRRVNSIHFPGYPNIPEVGVFLWRRKAYSVTQTPAYCFEEESPNCYLFSVLGNDTQLFTNASAAQNQPPGELNLPVPIRRRGIETQELAGKPGATTSGVPFYFGKGKSMQIFLGSPVNPVPSGQIVAADLTDWTYRPLANQVAVDPVLGRIVFPPGMVPRQQDVLVNYYYGFSADIGGGEYDRVLSQPPGARVYRVTSDPTTPDFHRITDALTQWQTDAPADAVVEIQDSSVYVEQISISLGPNQTLQLRAANKTRPVIRLLDWKTSHPDSLSVSGKPGSYFTLDGLLVTGRGMEVEAIVAGVIIRHSTLVPGWGLECNCEPHRTNDPSLVLTDSPNCLTIEHSIIGGIQVDRDEVKLDPLLIHLSDSILDATSQESIAIGAEGSLCADAKITILRCTVFGQIQSRELQLVENSILMGILRVCRRQQGCVRFSYLTNPSRTPRRYECQPDLVLQAVDALLAKDDITQAEAGTLKQSEALRVEPQFNSVRYGTPSYCQLAYACADEITRGAEDQSEMGVFHDLYQPQREDALRTRLAEFTPAGMDVGLLFAD
jgi:hypothetical protein